MLEPFSRPIRQGAMVVLFWPSQEREIAKESDFTLEDRALRAGDVVKRHEEGLQSGIVIKAEVQAKLVHAISGVSLPGWINDFDVDHAEPCCAGSYVVWNNWLGQVCFSKVYCNQCYH